MTSENGEKTPNIHDEKYTDHMIRFEKIDSKIDQTNERINALLSFATTVEKIGESISNLTINFAQVANTVEQQGKAFEKVAATVEQQGKDFSRIAVIVEQQAKDSGKMLALYEKQSEQMQNIQSQMTDKNTIDKMQERLENAEKDYIKHLESLEDKHSADIKEIDKRMTEMEDKPKDELYAQWGKMKSYAIGAVVFIGTGLLLIGLGVMYMIITKGAPMP